MYYWSWLSERESSFNGGFFSTLDQIERQNYELSQLRQANQNYANQLESLEKIHLANTEKIRKQDDLLAKARTEISRRDQRHHRQLSELYTRINSLQTTTQVLFSDEQVVNEMRKLCQNLESWIKSNFKYISTLATAEEIPRSTPQRRAYIQDYICSLVYRKVFAPYHINIEDNPLGKFLTEFENQVQYHCQSAGLEMIYKHWKVGTSIALGEMSKPFQDTLLIDIIDSVERKFQLMPSTVRQLHARQLLRQFLQQCIDFKIKLAQQPTVLRFYCSDRGGDYMPGSMTFAGGEEVEGGGEGEDESNIKVKYRLWPGIEKYDQDNLPVALETELVWTTKKV